MNSWPICEKEPVVNIRTLTSHLLLFLQLFFFFKFPEDLLFVFCCRFRKNGFDILFTNCKTNQKFHVLVNLKALCIMYKWCVYGLHEVTHLPSSILWSITRVFRKMLTHTWMNAALQGSLSLKSLVM